MNFDLRRVYFNAVLGGLGGLLGWAVVAALPGGSSEGGWRIYLSDVLIGIACGVCIGGAVGAADGIVTNRSAARVKRGMSYGAMIGAAGGAVGLLLGEVVFSLAGGGVWPRAVGWAIFGLFVGASEGFACSMPTKVRYGMLGGLLGGLIGGSTYERLSLVLVAAFDDRALAIALGSALGLIILGACIGALAGLVESILRTALLQILNGRDEGQRRTLDPAKPRVVLGSSNRCDLVLGSDANVGDTHATITREDGRFVIQPNGGLVALMGAGGPISIDRHVLTEGDQLALGNLRFIFHEQETKS